MRQTHPVSMRRAVAIAALLASGVTWPAASRAQAMPPCLDTLTLHLVDRAALPPETRDAMMREVIVPWRAAGVLVRWAADADRPTGGPEEVYIVVRRAVGDSSSGAVTGALPLASILFVDGRPTTQVSVHATEVMRLLDGVRVDDRPWREQPRLMRDRLAGRVLGRAIAHELGHYLLASAAHASEGLMRAVHPVERLLAASPSPFRVVLPP